MKWEMGMALVLVLGISAVTTTATAVEEMIPIELANFFDGFDFDGDGELCLDEAGRFYYWVEGNVKYRYDDESDPDGLKQLETERITQAELGDGREGPEYWQKPIETYREGYGDCEDMAILEHAFYVHWGIESYVAGVDVAGGGELDHGICIAWLEEEALEELVGIQGVAYYYEYDGNKFAIVDNAYSDEYGFVGKMDPFTGESFPEEEVNFSLYEDYTLDEIYEMRWAPPEEGPTPLQKEEYYGADEESAEGVSGFEVISAIIGFLAVAYLVRRRMK